VSRETTGTWHARHVPRRKTEPRDCPRVLPRQHGGGDWREWERLAPTGSSSASSSHDVKLEQKARTCSRGGCGLPRQRLLIVHAVLRIVDKFDSLLVTRAIRAGRAPKSKTRLRLAGESPAIFPSAHAACSRLPACLHDSSEINSGTAPASMTCCVCAAVPEAMLVRIQAASYCSIAERVSVEQDSERRNSALHLKLRGIVEAKQADKVVHEARCDDHVDGRVVCYAGSEQRHASRKQFHEHCVTRSYGHDHRHRFGHQWDRRLSGSESLPSSIRIVQRSLLRTRSSASIRSSL
jgi:hypothetical protein